MHTKAVFFDLYQTLIDVDAVNEKDGTKTGFDRVIIPYLQQKGIPENKSSLVSSRYSDELQAFYKDHDIEQYQHSFPTILSTVFTKYYGVTISEDEMRDLLYEFRKISRGYLKRYDGVCEVLEALSNDYTLVVASHTQGVYTERELVDMEIRKYFTHCVYSSDIGLKKKSNAFYQKCLEIVGLEPQDCVMVGDNIYEDMFMAHQNGIHTVWIINPQTDGRNTAKVEPDARLPIESIDKLPDVISKIWNH